MPKPWKVVFVLLAVVLAGCAAQTSREGPPPAAITVSAGEQFDIRLPSNPTTGYRWQVDGKLNMRIVRLVDTRFEPTAPDPAVLGAGGTEIFTFVGVAAGTSRIKLVYLRPWEKGIAPARTAEYTVEVL